MKHRILTISRSPSNNPDYPFIKIAGKWLSEIGFTVGNKVLVESKKGTIQIKAIKFISEDNTSKEEKNE